MLRNPHLAPLCGTPQSLNHDHPDLSDLNDDLIAIGAGTLATRIVPPIASTQPAVTVEERRGSGRIIIPS